MSNCCDCNKRVMSNQPYDKDNGFCFDVCTMPNCGEPKFLTVLAPVVYDEIGANICRSISVAGYATEFPNMEYIDFQPYRYTFVGDDPGPVVTQITNRPNCYQVSLSQLSITFVARIYGNCKQLLGTRITSPITFLPPNTDPSFDAETNPSSLTFEVFAPYGVAYDNTATADAPVGTINLVGFSDANSQMAQGLNLNVIPKVLNYDITSQTVNLGLSLILSSIYFSPYLLPHQGKAPISKGLSPSERVSVCKRFVDGGLLDRSIKPLEFMNPFDKKEDCQDGDIDPCNNKDDTIDIFE